MDVIINRKNAWLRLIPTELLIKDNMVFTVHFYRAGVDIGRYLGYIGGES